MNKIEVAKLLARASAVDGRRVTEETVAAWWELLADVEYDAAVEALKSHYMTSEKYLMPAHVLKGSQPDPDAWMNNQSRIRPERMELDS
jgi:hypothetical protein